MVGIKDKSLSERLQMDAVLMLEKANRAIRQHEVIQDNRSLWRETVVLTVNALEGS